MPRPKDQSDIQLYAMAGMVGGMDLVGSLVESETIRETQSQNGSQKIHLPHMDRKDRIALELMGCKYVGPVDGDKLFNHWIIPVGWKFKSTGHYMYQDLCDEQGRKRGSQMYKGAAWDRDASFYTVPRFSIGYIHEDPGDMHSDMVPVIQDSNNTVLWRGTPIKDMPSYQRSREWLDRAVREGSGWECIEVAAPVFYRIFPKYGEYAKRIAAKKAQQSADYNNNTIQVQLEQYQGEQNFIYWDLDVTTLPDWDPARGGFKDWQSEVLPGQVYTLHISIYRDGNHVDSGDNSVKKAASDEAAITHLEQNVKAFLDRGYDEIRYSIRRADGSIAKRDTMKAPERPIIMEDSVFHYRHRPEWPPRDNSGRFKKIR